MVGVFAHRLIKEVLFSPWVVAVSLIVGGILILVIERVRPPPRIENVDDMRMRTALWIGCCQILAMIPGVSRAGATIMGGLMLGVDRPAATQFSFFLAVPTMLGAAVYDLYKNRAILSLENGTMIAIGFIVAFLVRALRRAHLGRLRQPPRLRRLRLVPHRPRRPGAGVAGPVALSGCARLGS